MHRPKYSFGKFRRDMLVGFCFIAAALECGPFLTCGFPTPVTLVEACRGSLKYKNIKFLQNLHTLVPRRFVIYPNKQHWENSRFSVNAGVLATSISPGCACC